MLILAQCRLLLAMLWAGALGAACSGGDGNTAAGGDSGPGGAGGGGAGGAATAGAGAQAQSCEPTSSSGGAVPLISCREIGGICGGCIASNACDLFEYRCALDADCVCMAKCVGSEGFGGVQACLGSCGLSGSPPGFAELAEVVATMCPDSDECSVPPGFTPPPDADASSGATTGSIAGGSLPDCSFDAGLPYDPNGEVVQLESADGSVCVRVERRNDGPGTNANTSWTLLDMRVGPIGGVCAADPAEGCWYSSHHNFDDWAHASCGGLHYDLNVAMTGHGAAPTYELLVFQHGPAAGASCAPGADGACPIGAPIELFGVP